MSCVFSKNKSLTTWLSSKAMQFLFWGPAAAKDEHQSLFVFVVVVVVVLCTLTIRFYITRSQAYKDRTFYPPKRGHLFTTV